MNTKLISSLISEYNRMRSPEAIANLVKTDDDKALIRFSGTFCESCGLVDYFEDFIIEAENVGLKITIKNIEQIDSENYLVEFKKI